MEGAKSAAKSMRALADLGDSVRSSTSSGAGDLIDMFGECLQIGEQWMAYSKYTIHNNRSAIHWLLNCRTLCDLQTESSKKFLAWVLKQVGIQRKSCYHLDLTQGNLYFIFFILLLFQQILSIQNLFGKYIYVF